MYLDKTEFNTQGTISLFFTSVRGREKNDLSAQLRAQQQACQQKNVIK